MGANASTFRIGEWTVERDLDELHREGAVVKLEPRAMRLLCVLAEQPGVVHSAETLLDRVWPGVVVGPNSVYQAIAQLRRALGDTGSEAVYIQTVPRRGYRLIAPVERNPVAASDEVVRSPASPDAPKVDRPRQRRTAIAAAALVVALTAGAAWWFVGVTERDDRAVPPAIAVMPFVDLSEDGTQAVFCEGLTDELIHSLARVPGLRVTGRTSVYAAPAERDDPRELGRVLGVAHVLYGAVRADGDRVRVSARLVSTDDGFQVWANAYDRARTGAIAVQTDIAREVVDSLRVRLAAAERDALARRPTADVSAYDLYLLGRHQQLQRNPEALGRAAEYHRRAIVADPRFALAHAALADTLMADFYYANRTLAEVAPLVEQEVAAALAIDPQLPEAYAARAVLRTEQWRMDDAIADLERAIAINPNVGEFYLRLGAAYEYAARPLQALAAYDEVRTLDPLHTIMHVRRCLVLQNLGRHEEAEAACARAFELQPDIPNALWARALNAYAQGRLDDAVRWNEQALARAPRRADIRAELGLLELDRGQLERARTTFEAARVGAGGRAVDVELAAAHARLLDESRTALPRDLATAPWLAEAGARDLLEAAALALAAGDADVGQQLWDRAKALPGFTEDQVHPGIYAVRWGRCARCTLALIERRRGDVEGADRRVEQVLAWLDRLEADGYRLHGLHYVRATLFAQQGRRPDALRELERAAELGWRRAWLAAVEPAFEPLREDPAFVRALARMQAPSRG